LLLIFNASIASINVNQFGVTIKPKDNQLFFYGMKNEIFVDFLLSSFALLLLDAFGAVFGFFSSQASSAFHCDEEEKQQNHAMHSIYGFNFIEFR